MTWRKMHRNRRNKLYGKLINRLKWGKTMTDSFYRNRGVLCDWTISQQSRGPFTWADQQKHYEKVMAQYKPTLAV